VKKKNMSAKLIFPEVAFRRRRLHVTKKWGRSTVLERGLERGGYFVDHI